MGKFHDKQFPGESAVYRQARDELLQMEIELRRQMEVVAQKRGSLPPGGKLKENYLFEEAGADLAASGVVKTVRFSELFGAGRNSLVLYSFMYGPDWEEPCAMCTSLLDSLNGTVPHAEQRVNVAVVAKAPVPKIRDWARARGWRNLRLLSSENNSYNTDYFAQNASGNQLPAVNVFLKKADGIYHFYSAELLFVPPEPGQDPRHADLIWPLWNLFDLTPERRGEKWYPKVSYRD